MFKEEREEYMFDWNMIGDIGEGRPNLGKTMDVAVYRLMQFTLRDALIKEFDTETADRIYYNAGELAGREFCKNMINKNNDFNGFIQETQELLSKLKIGILRVEEADLERYLESGLWQGKAGGCMVEGFCKKYIKSVDGYESTAMGLQVESLLPWI